MSDYRPVRRGASGEGKCTWLLLHVASGEMAGGNAPLTYTSKGDATRTGEHLTARRLNPEGLTPKQIAKAARRQAETAERDRTFKPHLPAVVKVKVSSKTKAKIKSEMAKAGPGSYAKPAKSTGTSSRGRVKPKRATRTKSARKVSGGRGRGG